MKFKMENISKFKQWILGFSVALMLGLGWACTDEDAPDNLAPGFSSYSVNEILRSSAVVSASLTGPVDLVKEYGFQYSTSSEFPTDKTKTVKAGEGSPVGSFQADFTGLERNEVYYYRVYASTGGTTVYSNYEVFTTLSFSKPSMEDTKVLEIGENYAKISFKLVDIGDEYLIECGVGYAKGTTSTAYTPVVATLQDSVYVADIVDLDANTTYSFRPYAKNSATADGDAGLLEGYGDVVVDKTDEQMAPDVTTSFEASSGISSITVSGVVESAIGSNGILHDCGFVWSSESQKPRLELNHQSVSMAAPEELGEYFVSTITGLMSNTTYYVCAYARNEVDDELKVGYGEVITVTTGSLMKPNINIDSYETTPSRIIMQATITNYDKGALKEKGFIYDRSSEISYDEAISKGQVIKTISGANVYSDTIPDLTMNTSYMVRAYAIYEAEGAEPAIGYSGSYNITTNDYQAPSIGVEANNVTRNSVDLTGKMYGTGNGNITERGFVLITTDVTYEPTLKHKGVMKIVSDDNFLSTVKDLKKETEYSYRSYVISSLEAKTDTVYSGSWNTFWTLGINAPSFNNVQISNEKYNSFEVKCGITDIGDGKLLEKGFIFKKGGSDYNEDADSVIVTSTDINEFRTTINRTFEYDNRYYVSCYVKKEIDGVEIISRSSSQSVWIPSPASPDFNEIRFDSITYKSFNAYCKLNSVGDGKLLEKGFYWRKNNTDFSLGVDSLIVESDSNEEFSALITGLESSSSYYGGVYVKREINGKEIITRSDGWTYAWIPSPSNASFYSVSLEDATYKSFKATSGIRNVGDGTLLEKGFYYWKNGYDFNEHRDSIIVESDANDEYSVIIEKNIDYNSYYYVNSYAKVERDSVILITTSDTHSIWIPGASGTSFAEVKLDSATYHSVIITSGITSMGDGTFLEKGFFWKKDGTDFSNGIDSLIVESDNNEEFTAKVIGLESNYWYYMGAYTKMDINGRIVINRSGWNSTWISSPNMPSFDNFNLNENAYRTLDVSVQINNSSDGEIIEKGFCWRQVGGENWDYESPTLEKNDSSFIFTGGDSIYTTIKDLEEGKEYYVRAYAKVKFPNGEHITYSGTHGRTISSLNMPTIEYWNWEIPDEDRTRTSFKVKSYLGSKGNATITHRGYVVSEYAKINEPTIENCELKYDDVDETFEKTITGLKHDTEYAVRPFLVAKSEEYKDTIYGDRTYVIWTRSATLPTFKSVSFSNQKLSEMTVTSEIKDLGDGVLKEKGFCWDRSTSDFTLETETTKKQAVTTDSLKLTLTDLDFNTRYYVRAYAKVEVDGIEYVAYSDQNNDRTSSYSYPSMSSAEINGDLTTRNSAALSCVLHSSGNGVIIEKGFVLSKCAVTYEPTLENCAVKVVADNEFTATATDLDWNTEYAVRGYVTSKWEETGQVTTEYSGWRNTFWTKDINNPTFNSVQVDSVSYSSIVVTSGVASVGDGEFVEKGFIWTDCNNDYWREPTIDNFVGMEKVVSEENESYLLKVDSLMPNRRYGVRAYVKFTVDGKEGIGYSSTNHFYTSSLSANVNWTPQVTSCDFTAEFTDEASNIKKVYVYLTTDSNENDLSKWTKYEMVQDETTLAFSKTVDELTQNTTYRLKVYYEYAGNLIEYTNGSFTTRRIPQSGDNVSPGMKGDE